MKFYKDADQKNVAANILYPIRDVDSTYLLKKELPSITEIIELVDADSKHDDSVSDYIDNFAKQYGVKEDELLSIVFGNYFVKRPRSGSSEFYKIDAYRYGDDFGVHYVQDSGGHNYDGVREDFHFEIPQ